jgi:hypothetical protein
MTNKEVIIWKYPSVMMIFYALNLSPTIFLWLLQFTFLGLLEITFNEILVNLTTGYIVHKKQNASDYHIYKTSSNSKI